MLHEVFLFGVLLPTVITVVCFIGFLICWFRYNWRRRTCCHPTHDDKLPPPPPTPSGRKSVGLKCACGGVARRTSRYEEEEEAPCTLPRWSASSGEGRCERCFGRGATVVYPAETGVRPMRFSSSSASSSWSSYAVVDPKGPLWLAPDEKDLEAAMMNYVVAEPRKNLLRCGLSTSTGRTSRSRKTQKSGRCGCSAEWRKTPTQNKGQRVNRHREHADLNDLASAYGRTRGQFDGRHDLDMTGLPVEDDTTPFDVFSSHDAETFYVEVQPNIRENATKERSTRRNPDTGIPGNDVSAASCDDCEPQKTASESTEGSRHIDLLNHRDPTDLKMTSRLVSNDSETARRGLTSVSIPESSGLNRWASDLALDDSNNRGHSQHRAIVRRLGNGYLATSNNGSAAITQSRSLDSCSNNQTNHSSEDDDLSPLNSSELSPLDSGANLSAQNVSLPQYIDDISPPRSSKTQPDLTERSSENSSDLSTRKTSEP